MNQVTLIGNLAKDPELIDKAEMPICKFTIAVNNGKGKPADYIPVTVFGSQGSNCHKFLQKGSKAAISGRIRTGSYTNNEGKKIYTWEVVASYVEFLSRAEPQEQDDVPVGFENVTDDVTPF